MPRREIVKSTRESNYLSMDVAKTLLEAGIVEIELLATELQLTLDKEPRTRRLVWPDLNVVVIVSALRRLQLAAAQLRRTIGFAHGPRATRQEVFERLAATGACRGRVERLLEQENQRRLRDEVELLVRISRARKRLVRVSQCAEDVRGRMVPLIVRVTTLSEKVDRERQRLGLA